MAMAAMPPTTPPAMAPPLEVFPAAPSVEEGAPAEGEVVLGLPVVGVEVPLEPVVVVESEALVEEVWPEVLVVVVLDETEFVALGAPVVLEALVVMAVWLC